MAAPQNVYAFDPVVAAAAADRWERRAQQHKKFARAVRTGRYSELDTPERCALRAERLIRQMHEAAPAEAAALEAAVAGGPVDDTVLERVIGQTRDFQFIEFLERALHVSRAVGRVVTRLDRGRVGYGTGFLVSPRLLLTNHHVLPTEDAAGRSEVQFDYQRDRTGRELPARPFRLDPAAFYLSDKRLDFALVAVAPGAGLAGFGWCPLIGEQGKIVAGEPINIVQHPKGELKQAVLRENRLIDVLGGDDFVVHYEADTEPGSSGSPVFNDQWEVVALHHSGVPRRNAAGDMLDIDGQVWRKGGDPSRLEWVANEGIRVSRLVAHLRSARVPPAHRSYLDEVLAAAPPPNRDSAPLSVPSTPNEVAPMSRPHPTAGTVTLTVPLHITISLGTPAAPGVIVTSAGAHDDELRESGRPRPNYDARPGYDANFLGFAVPLPKLTSATRPKAFALPGGGTELKYFHSSAIFNKERKLAFVAAVNYDPTAAVQYPRDDGDQWFYDPRVPRDLQAGEDLYKRNPLDRGHLVRRADAAWGDTEASAKAANDDTFHFTNCSPQHEITNQGQSSRARAGLKLWGKLENHVAAQGQ